ncbi:hypothetical protein [Nocardia sp. XZ_19_385]|uniref:hypothetical protein n=1 Tax=Nocardia sp. XZ_19_385 TaxID=2769488 RepID=UPI001890424C|nr:hypothetical protein [Nocardia sp. XZ_19_385]
MSNPFASGHECDWLAPGLEVVALRLARADAAVYELCRVAALWSMRGPLEIKQVERTAGVLDIEVIAVRPVPPVVGMLFSEAVNHLRSAIENTLFYLVEQSRGAALPEEQAKRIEMPVKADSLGMAEWHKSVARKVPELAAGTVLGGRVAVLQPYADPTAIPSVEPSVAALMGVQPEYEAPLVLLQRYSNTDKHRSIRVGVAQTMFNLDSTPDPARKRVFEPIEVGTVLARVPKGVLEFGEAQTAVVVERPDTATMVAPAMELTRLHRHVADVVIPTLVTGLVLPRSLPPGLDLDDTGLSLRERLQVGDWAYATDRFGPEREALYLKAMQAPAQFLDVEPSGE